MRVIKLRSNEQEESIGTPHAPEGGLSPTAAAWLQMDMDMPADTPPTFSTVPEPDARSSMSGYGSSSMVANTSLSSSSYLGNTSFTSDLSEPHGDDSKPVPRGKATSPEATSPTTAQDSSSMAQEFLRAWEAKTQEAIRSWDAPRSLETSPEKPPKSPRKLSSSRVPESTRSGESLYNVHRSPRASFDSSPKSSSPRVVWDSSGEGPRVVWDDSPPGESPRVVTATKDAPKTVWDSPTRKEAPRVVWDSPTKEAPRVVWDSPAKREAPRVVWDSPAKKEAPRVVWDSPNQEAPRVVWDSSSSESPRVVQDSPTKASPLTLSKSYSTTRDYVSSNDRGPVIEESPRPWESVYSLRESSSNRDPPSKAQKSTRSWESPSRPYKSIRTELRPVVREEVVEEDEDEEVMVTAWSEDQTNWDVSTETVNTKTQRTTYKTHSGEVVTTQEGGSFDGGISPSRLEDTLPTFQQPKRYVKPEEKRESKAAPGVIIMGAGDNRCALCDKRVYEMEKMIADKAIYHKMCFKCSHCKRILSLGNFASMEGMLYCKPHFIEMFKTKGNYDEGFGKEKHSKQWQKESTPTRDQSAAADDKFDDGIESVQSISNIKNRFQNKDEKPPMPGDSMNRSSRSSNGHVNGDRTPPEVVNRSESQEDILGRELPPVNMARSMASKFRDMESSDSNSDRKPVRKMTPPRDDVERDVGRYNEEVERRGDVIRSDEAMEKEDERPPPSFTRNMLAKFKEMEDTERPPPSPARSATSPTKRTHRPIATHIKSSPDEGIADTEPVNGHRGAEVIREADKNETEELPERGFTKSLVSQWRQIEQTAGGPTKSPLAPRQHGSTPSAVRNATTYRHASPANSESDEQREVVRESDNYEEENLPPPSYTKNMLAKFQNMQEEAQRDPATTPTKKQFKWTVKETKPLWAPPTGKDELQLQSVNGHDVTYEEAFSSEEEEYEDTISLECDEFGNPVYPVNHPKHPTNVRRRKERRMKRSSQEVISSNGPAETEESLPAPETTKKLLSQFKSMEDVSAPPPTPEMSVQRQRSTRSSISAVSMRYSTSSMESREQPDGIETTEVNIDRESSSEERTDVVREADSDVAAELPEQGTTRNLLARFQSLQAV